MPFRLFGHGRERGSQGDPSTEPIKVLNDTPFKVRALSTVSALVSYGQPSHPSVLRTNLRLIADTAIIGQYEYNGTVRGVLDSEARRLAVSNGNDGLEDAEAATATALVGRQQDLRSALTPKGIGRGNTVRIELIAPIGCLEASEAVQS